jgi:nucleotide-binding universal stress UspA family protein
MMKGHGSRSRRSDRGQLPVASTARNEAPRSQGTGFTAAARRPRIVVGVDGSAASIAALRWAVRQASFVGATVETVISWQVSVYGAEYGVPAPDLAGAARETLDLAVMDALGSGCGIAKRVVCGRPADVLVAAAAEADLLVIGSRGLGAVLSVLLRSVSKRVVTHAQCPVVVIRTSCGPPPNRPPGDPWKTVTAPAAPAREAPLSEHERNALDNLEQQFSRPWWMQPSHRRSPPTTTGHDSVVPGGTAPP